MKPVLIDSDILIEVSRGRDQAIVELWSELSRSETPILCSPITVAEIWHGARPQEYDVVEALFAAIPCVPMDAAIGKLCGELLRRFYKSHRVELADAFIAATALAHGLQLWTRNKRHYPMKDLSFLESPY